nr:hypothetical protein TetV2_00605 [Oceanusvirus sp.]
MSESPDLGDILNVGKMKLNERPNLTLHGKKSILNSRQPEIPSRRSGPSRPDSARDYNDLQQNQEKVQTEDIFAQLTDVQFERLVEWFNIFSEKLDEELKTDSPTDDDIMPAASTSMRHLITSQTSMNDKDVDEILQAYNDQLTKYYSQTLSDKPFMNSFQQQQGRSQTGGFGFAIVVPLSIVAAMTLVFLACMVIQDFNGYTDASRRCLDSSVVGPTEAVGRFFKRGWQAFRTSVTNVNTNDFIDSLNNGIKTTGKISQDVYSSVKSFFPKVSKKLGYALSTVSRLRIGFSVYSVDSEESVEYYRTPVVDHDRILVDLPDVPEMYVLVMAPDQRDDIHLARRVGGDSGARTASLAIGLACLVTTAMVPR